jgi:hypothetical protein
MAAFQVITSNKDENVQTDSVLTMAGLIGSSSRGHRKSSRDEVKPCCCALPKNTMTWKRLMSRSRRGARYVPAAIVSADACLPRRFLRSGPLTKSKRTASRTHETVLRRPPLEKVGIFIGRVSRSSSPPSSHRQATARSESSCVKRRLHDVSRVAQPKYRGDVFLFACRRNL